MKKWLKLVLRGLLERFSVNINLVSQICETTVQDVMSLDWWNVLFFSTKILIVQELMKSLIMINKRMQVATRLFHWWWTVCGSSFLIRQPLQARGTVLFLSSILVSYIKVVIWHYIKEPAFYRGPLYAERLQQYLQENPLVWVLN